MILARIANDVVNAIFPAGIAGIMSGAKADPREAALTSFRTSFATKYAEPVDGAILVSVKTKFGQVIEMSRVRCRVQCAEECVLLFPQP